MLAILCSFSTVGAQSYSGGLGTEIEPYQINTLDDLKYLSQNSEEWSKNFILTSDLTFTNADYEVDGRFYNNGNGFSPIGTHEGIAFTGSFNGNNYSIDGLYIHNSTEGNKGFFGRIEGGTVLNLTLSNIDITCTEVAGGLSARTSYGNNDINTSIVNCHVQGSVVITGSAGYVAGGIVGFLGYTSMSACSADISIEGTRQYAGGIAGHINTNCTIRESYSIGNILSYDYSGGLVGGTENSNIIINCFSGVVINADHVRVGALIGNLKSGTSISNCYATKKGSHTGIVGYDNGVTSYSDLYYLEGELSGIHGTGLSLIEMGDQTNYNNWDFDNVWEISKVDAIDNEYSFPYLKWMVNSVELTFDANGGNGSMDKMGDVYGLITLPDNSFVKNGFGFIGWSTTIDGDAEYINGGTLTITKSMKLYAVWAEDIIKVPTKDAHVRGYTSSNGTNTNFGDAEFMHIVDSEYGSRYDYKTAISFDLLIDINKLEKAELLLFHDGHENANTGTNEFRVYNYTNNWEEMEITYNNAPSIPNTSLYVQAEMSSGYADHVLDVSELIKQNNGETDFFLALSNGKQGSKQEVRIASREHADLAKQPKLRLTFNEEFTITFNSNGGNGSMSDIIGLNLSLPENIFTNGNYTFTGWSTSAEGDAEYTDGSALSPTQDLTLYAVWSLSTSLEDNYQNSAKVYPNPTSDIVWLELNDLQNTSYCIRTVSGEVLERSNNVTSRNRIDLSNYSKGVYLLTVMFDDNTVKTFKVVKN